MRVVALALTALMAWAADVQAQDQDSGLCSTAQRAASGTLPAVVQACTRAAQAQATAVEQAKQLRYRGIALARAGNVPAAVADFNQVLQATPDDTAALQGRAQANEALGQRQLAAADYARLAALKPADTRWRLKVAALGETAPQAVAAAPVPAAPQATAPQPLVAPRAPGASPTVVAQAPQVAAAPTPLVQAQPQVAAVQATKGMGVITGDEGVVCATAIKAPAETLPAVIRACGKIQAKQPTAVDRARVLRYRGIALQRTGDQSGAIADFDQVLALTPEDTWALQGRAEAHELLGHVPQAIADYSRLAALRPGDTRWRIKIGQLGGTAPAPTQTAQSPPAAAPAAEAAPAVTAAAPPAAEPPAAAPAADDPVALTRKLQIALRELGYDVGAVNGRVGAKTRQAMDLFAADVGLPAGGEPDAELLGAADDQLNYRREQVVQQQRQLGMRAQQALADLGYDIGDIDGVVGSRTRNALRAWSSIRGQPVTEVDEEVVAALEEAVVERISVPEAAAPPQTAEAVSGTVTVGQSQTAFEEAQPTAIDEFAADLSAAPSVAAPTALPVAEPQGTPTPAVEATPTTRAPGGYDIIPAAIEAPEKRVALVIGNARYQAVTPLVNPTNDADDVAAALSELGFEVLRGIDLSRESMSRVTRDFARRSKTADIAMAYYSGHGMQFERTNYLVPVDGQITDEYDLREMVELDQVIRDTSQAKKVGIVVVDACRNDPLETKSLARSLGLARSGSVAAGLAAPKLPPSQSLIAYATAADFVAYDGDAGARNSPFTAALLKNLKTPKLDVRQLFGKVSDEVRKATGNEQRPDIWAALGGDPIYLVPGPPEPVGLEMVELTEGEVLVVQRSLKLLKYWSGPEDGIATPELTPAVRSWQRTLGAEQSGRLVPQQMIALNRMAARDRPRQPLPEFTLNEIVGRAFGGDIEAQRLMGMMYDPAFDEAPGFTKDRTTAQNFYQKAASQGDVRAAGLLGSMLVAGDNPTPDRDAGMQWLETAATGGDPASALRLAELVVERQPDAAGRAKAVPFLKIAAADSSTSGMANAWLRYIGQPAVQ